PTGRWAAFAPGVIDFAPANISYVTADVGAVDLVGGTGADVFRAVATLPGVPVAIDGGGGADTLVGPDLLNNWRVNAPDAGSVGNVSFTRVGGLTGGALDDKFILASGAGLSGRV